MPVLSGLETVALLRRSTRPARAPEITGQLPAAGHGSSRSKGSPLSTFEELGASPETVGALKALGIETAFPIQELTIPIALTGADLIGQARTGTGKTLAFGVPLLDRIELGRGVVQALVVVPTRELCIQVAGDLERVGKDRSVRVTAIYGGRAFEPQLEALRKGVDVVVGTPGRLLDLARQGHLKLGDVRILVLDEADEMLDLGFLPDVEKIMSLSPDPSRQTLLFSATMPGPIITLARRFLKTPMHIRAEEAHEEQTVPTTQQHVFRAHALDKVEMLARLLQAEERGLTMVFCRTKRGCDKVGADLVERGFAAGAVHGDLAQGAREQVLRAFRSGKIDVLVATDVAARGIDISGVTHVVNYQCPDDEKTYLHRIGRTGRAGESGVAVTFVDWDDLPKWAAINTALSLPFPDPPETYSSSQWFYDALDIPKEAKGVLPRAQRTRAGLAAEELEDVGETGRKRKPRAATTAPASRQEDGDPLSRVPPRTKARRRVRKVEGGEVTVTAPAAPVAAGEGEAPKRRRRRGGRGRGGGGGGTAVAEA
ncbi:MAG TPA: DEAD/DEAH box helicase [Frankiaceae bacterium]|nr:DEAD/DEAH box helicase [Frankiaceae bacterium]